MIVLRRKLLGTDGWTEIGRCDTIDLSISVKDSSIKSGEYSASISSTEGSVILTRLTEPLPATPYGFKQPDFANIGDLSKIIIALLRQMGGAVIITENELAESGNVFTQEWSPDFRGYCLKVTE